MRQVGRTTATIEKAVKAAREGKDVWLVLANAQHEFLVIGQIRSYEGARWNRMTSDFTFNNSSGALHLTTIEDPSVDLQYGKVRGVELDVILADHYACEVWLQNTWAGRELEKINREALGE